MKCLLLAVDLRHRNEQADFKRGRGCSDHMLRNVIEKCTKWQQSVRGNFADFVKAFTVRTRSASDRHYERMKSPLIFSRLFKASTTTLLVVSAMVTS